MKESMRILIAESDIKIVNQLKNYLVSFGHKVFPGVTSGEDLMKFVELLNPSLIITDINLNGQLDGVEAIARLQGSYNIPYIFITVSDDYISLIYSYNLNPVSIIKKPVYRDNLYESVEKAQLEPELV
jgi:two-component system, cell cycle sensor histidine kinase and response regulator CckA